MILMMIRHGKTPGNEEKRYIGRTDEPLSERGIVELNEKQYPKAQKIFLSPMLRCVQTAELIYPQGKGENHTYTLVEGFREIDFGLFEGKNYKELTGNELYQKWIDSGGTMDFPQGEALAHFKERVIRSFEEVTQKFADQEELCFIVHGGTIMTLLERYEEKHSYYDWQCANGCGFRVEYRAGSMKVLENIG